MRTKKFKHHKHSLYFDPRINYGKCPLWSINFQPFEQFGDGLSPDQGFYDPAFPPGFVTVRLILNLNRQYNALLRTVPGQTRTVFGQNGLICGHSRMILGPSFVPFAAGIRAIKTLFAL
jgi:hypothetical protein